MASDRLLTLMDKGITVAQAARPCRSLAGSGISVHAYLMYGFPTETEQDTLDNLERVRQLFALGYIRSTNWSPFSLTLHSPVARNPDRYGIRLCIPHGDFACPVVVPYEAPTLYGREQLGLGLKRASYHFGSGKFSRDRGNRVIAQTSPSFRQGVPEPRRRGRQKPGDPNHYRAAGWVITTRKSTTTEFPTRPQFAFDGVMEHYPCGLGICRQG